MNYGLLALSVFSNAFNSILSALFIKRNRGNGISTNVFSTIVFLFNVISYLFLWIKSGAEINITSIPFAIGFGLCTFATTICNILAIKHGSTFLSTLFLQLACVGTVLYGMVFWDETPTWSVWLGLIMVVITLVLCVGDSDENGKKINYKWLFFASVSLVGNCGCTVIQKSHQMKFDGEHGNFMMMTAVTMSLLISVVMMITSKEKKDFDPFKKTVWMPAFAGIATTVTNCVVMYLAIRLPSEMVYPVVTVGGLVIVLLTSVFAFKEKLIIKQWVGVVTGIIAILILSL